MTNETNSPATPPAPLIEQRSPNEWREWAAVRVRTARTRLISAGVVLLLGLGTGALALVLFSLLTEDVLEGETRYLDNTVLDAVRQMSSPLLDVAARGFSMLGLQGVFVLLVLFLVWFARQRRWGAAAGLLVTTAGALLLDSLLKGIFHRTRPGAVVSVIPVQAFSFPSGHAMLSAAFFAFLAYIAWRALHGWKRAVATGGLVLLVLLVGWSRLYLGVHFPTDVVGGYLGGLIWVDAVIIAARVIGQHHAGGAAVK